MTLTTVTIRGVYPIGYILTIFDGVDLNWVHIAFSVADVVDKMGVATVAYMAAKRVVEQEQQVGQQKQKPPDQCQYVG